MKKGKLIAIIVISILTIIIFLQNTETVETHILFMTITMSRALLLILTFVLGAVVGLLIGTHFLTIRKKK